MNDPLFSREALHEYTKHPEKSAHVKAMKRKNCYNKADEKNEMTECKSCNGKHNLGNCQFYHEITVDVQNSFLKKNRLCCGCYAEISPKHTARKCKNRRNCKVCQGKHPTGLNGYKTKDKKSPHEAKASNKSKTAMKSNCAGMQLQLYGNTATKLGEVLSMC